MILITKKVGNQLGSLIDDRQSKEEIESYHGCNTDKDCVGDGLYTKCGCVFDDCGICIEPGKVRVTRSATEGIM